MLDKRTFCSNVVVKVITPGLSGVAELWPSSDGAPRSPERERCCQGAAEALVEGFGATGSCHEDTGVTIEVGGPVSSRTTEEPLVLRLRS